MALICEKCGEENPKTNRFCDNCGSKLPKLEAKPEPVTAPKALKKEAEARPQGPARRAEVAPALAPATGVVLDSNLLWLALIVAFGAFLRLWQLGDKPLHHDESIHAWYAFKLFKGDVYKYDPAYHGPFRYHFNALMYFVFGVSDFSARILPAIFGIGLLVFMAQWRSLLGATGVLFAAALMAISPSWAYVSRFIRDDIFMVAGSMTLVWGLFRWYEARADRYLYWAVAGLIVAFSAHEGTWIFMGIIGSFLMVRWAWETFDNKIEEESHVRDLVDRLKLLESGSGLAQLMAALFAPLTLLLGAVGILQLRESRKAWIAMLAIFFVPFTLLYSTMFSNLDGWFIGAFDSIAYWLGEQKTGRADQPWQFYIYMLSLYELGICAFAFIGGLRVYFGSGKPQLFFLKILAFLPFVFAIMILERYPKDPRMVLVMAGLATAGSGMAAWSTFAPEKGNHFKVFLIYWAMLAFVMFTIAGERMPWLTVHPLTPLTLLAAMYLSEFFERDKPYLGEHWLGWGLLWLPISYLLVMMPRQLLQALVHAPREVGSWLKAFGHGGRHGSFQPSGWNINLWNEKFFVLLPLAVFAVLLALTPFILERWPRLKGMTRGIFVGLFVLALGALSHGTQNLLFHGDGADPREQHVYVQSSVELVELTAKLERMSRALTGGPYLKIAVEDLCSWPMSWYLRDLPNSQIGFGPPMTADKVPDFPVAMTGYDNGNIPDHDQRVADSFKATHNPYPVRFRRWWAPDKNALLQGSTSDVAGRLFRLYMYREPWMGGPIRNPQFSDYVYPKGDSINSPFGSFDAVVWVRKDVDRYFQ